MRSTVSFSTPRPGFLSRPSPRKAIRWAPMGEGTHTVMLEKNRMQFFREIIGFLSESDPLAVR